jgi:hypothetical protein
MSIEELRARARRRAFWTEFFFIFWISVCLGGFVALLIVIFGG